jgi:hypothetical protein
MGQSQIRLPLTPRNRIIGGAVGERRAMYLPAIGTMARCAVRTSSGVLAVGLPRTAEVELGERNSSLRGRAALEDDWLSAGQAVCDEGCTGRYTQKGSPDLRWTALNEVAPAGESWRPSISMSLSTREYPLSGRRTGLSRDPPPRPGGRCRSSRQPCPLRVIRSGRRPLRLVGPEQAEQTAQKVLADWGQLLRLSLHSVEYPRPAQRGLPD